MNNVVIAAMKIDLALFLSENNSIKCWKVYIQLMLEGVLIGPPALLAFIAKSGYADVFFTKLLVHLLLVNVVVPQ